MKTLVCKGTIRELFSDRRVRIEISTASMVGFIVVKPDVIIPRHYFSTLYRGQEVEWEVDESGKSLFRVVY